jgi:uncharacterized protein (TIGR00290 family)
MAAVLEKHKARGVSKVAFGDIFLEDLRRYRESKLALAGLKGLFPLWKKNTRRLAEEFIGLGFRAVTTCVDLKCLTAEFSGRQFDKDFLKQLPKGVDPCGENGEFHTFVYDGPIFRSKISYELGKSVIREKRFCFRDLVPHA